VTNPPRPSIVITVDSSAFTSPDIADLAKAMKERVHECEVRVEQETSPPAPPRDPRKKYRVASDWPTVDALTTIAISVPWEALTSALATIVLEGIRDWTAKRVRQQKQVLHERAERKKAQRTPLQKLQDRLRPKPPVPNLLPTSVLGRVPIPHQVVKIYGPRGQLLAIVRQDNWQESPSVETLSPSS
jgi:hypothetical protein